MVNQVKAHAAIHEQINGNLVLVMEAGESADVISRWEGGWCIRPRGRTDVVTAFVRFEDVFKTYSPDVVPFHSKGERPNVTLPGTIRKLLRRFI